MALDQMNTCSWRTLDSLELRRQVEDTVNSFGSRLQRIDDVKGLLAQKTGVRGELEPARREVLLADGIPGLCFLLGLLDREQPDRSWDLVGHTLLVELQQALANCGPLGLGLWQGLSGVVFGVRALSRQGTRYQTMIGKMQQLLYGQGREWVERLNQQLNEGLHMLDYDVIGGIAGLGRALLSEVEENEEARSEGLELLEEVLKYLVRLAGEKELSGQQVPACHISATNFQVSEHREIDPGGYFIVGLAHGIVGPLALFSLALRQGIEVPGQREAIISIVEWLLRWKIEDQRGVCWPGYISWKEWSAGELSPESRVRERESWCYGVPGIARTLWLAGDALENADWKEFAQNAFRSIGRMQAEEWRLNKPMLCHGVAGLLQITQRMYSETGDPELGHLRDRLVRQLLDQYDEEHPLGFASDDFSLLEGAVGAALVCAGLLADQEPNWDAVLFIR